jgi:hypothetical protein
MTKAFTKKSGLTKYWVYKNNDTENVEWRVSLPLNHPSGGGYQTFTNFDDALGYLLDMLAIDNLNKLQ